MSKKKETIVDYVIQWQDKAGRWISESLVYSRHSWRPVKSKKEAIKYLTYQINEIVKDRDFRRTYHKTLKRKPEIKTLRLIKRTTTVVSESTATPIKTLRRKI